MARGLGLEISTTWAGWAHVPPQKTSPLAGEPWSVFSILIHNDDLRVSQTQGSWQSETRFCGVSWDRGSSRTRAGFGYDGRFVPEGWAAPRGAAGVPSPLQSQRGLLGGPIDLPRMSAAHGSQEAPALDRRRAALRHDAPSPMRGGLYACCVPGTTMSVFGFAVPVLLFAPGIVFPWHNLAPVDDLFLGFGVGLEGQALPSYTTRHGTSSPD